MIREHSGCGSLPAPSLLRKDIRVRTHTYQYTLATPVPDSTPPEHKPNTDATPGKWDHLGTRTDGQAVVAEIASLGRDSGGA